MYSEVCVLLIIGLCSKKANANRWKLNGKNIVVTGGTKGIGKAIVEECVMLGGNVFTCCRNDTELQDALKQWSHEGYSVQGVAADVSKPDDRKRLVEEVTKYFDGVVDVLVNNVGTNIRNKAVDYTEDDYRIIMATNLESSFFLCQSFYPCLRKSGRGSIINVGSVAGGNNIAIKSGVIYAMTKAALNQMSYNLACEWAKDNIRVNAVSPWYIFTPLTEKV